ncbi:beta-N-acetylhexosaminidase [Pedobacter heparinus]|uniref:beta-N-acetylhexosaminidase n=1 Tax=Pedobacter heparinus TaxID=984 RepID=UPI0029308AD4|nr:family 20 glycosylhydrolase [Pedobacter heparinus]
MKPIILFQVLVLLVSNCYSQKAPVSIIPQPVSLETTAGKFRLGQNTVIQINSDNDELRRVAAYLSAKLSGPTGYLMPVKIVKLFSKNNIHLTLSGGNKGIKEGYELNVTASGVSLTADSGAGLFYGVQTLIQLLPAEIESKKKISNLSWTIPGVKIKDYPRFGWRGILFDVTRHFFSKKEVKDFIDHMAKYKFNLLHLHLSDDQGWRLQIKSLPKLTEVGAWRPERKGKWNNTGKPSANEPKSYGGFYTQDDMLEIIKYAGDRFITILPEFDVPGHSLAALASYPSLSCTTDSTYAVNVGETIANWHSDGPIALLDNTLCPANEQVYTFLETVFTEVAALFPAEYIHIGGDECLKTFWKNNPAILALMKREGLKDMDEVQSYFIKRVANILKSKGKKLVGWDEILEGGLPPEATVMSWRGMKGGIQAANAGHQVVMSPEDFVYCDKNQGEWTAEPASSGMVRLKKTYSFEPVPNGIDEKLILGAQGNLWTEQIQNMRAAQYMLWPRGLAIAECVWSPKKSKNWPDFVRRVEHEFTRMDIGEIKYAKSMYDPMFRPAMEGDLVKLTLDTEVSNLKVHYSYDGSFPDNYYPEYTRPLIIPKDVNDVILVTYRNGKQMGKLIKMPVAELRTRIK